ncbi:AaceriADL022Cp [[Ashbya] aceris (nom. inval.)]|nr:AaceriADL022Cp [[Ashbya] aceris (nom. inval.)]
MGEENQELRGGQAGQVYGYYVALRQFCDVTGNSQDRSTSTRAQKARAKLLKLSPAQFFELSTDVHDELQRRIDETQEQPDHLLPKDHFHVKRNQARQKLANLSQTRFNDLVDDILYEIQRRGYHLRKPEHSSHAMRGSPHHTRQSVPHSGSEASPSKVQSPTTSVRGQENTAERRKSDKSSPASGQVPMLVTPNTSVQTSQVIPKTASIDWSSDEEEVASATKRVSRLKHMSKVMISTEDGTVVSPTHASPASYSAKHSSPKPALSKQASPKAASKHPSPKHGSISASPKHPSPKSMSVASTPSHKSVALMDTSSISPTSPLHQRTSSASRQALSAVSGRDKDRDIVLLLEEGNKLEAKLTQISEENKALERKSGELADQVTQLLTDKEQLTEQVLDLHTKLQESEKTVTNLTDEIVKLREKADSDAELKQQISALTDSGVELKQQISALKNQVNELTFENEALTQKNLTLTTQLADQDATVGRSMGDSFKEKLSALNSQLEELITQNQTLKLSKAELAAKLSKQQDIIASRSVDDNFQKQMSVLTNQLNDLSIENETLKQSNAELTLKLKRISNITSSPLNIFIPSSSKSTNVAIESISKFISPEGSIPLPLIKTFNSKLELVFRHLSQGEQTGNVLFEDIAQVSEVVEHMLNLVSPSDYQQATLLLKAATSHAITTIRYYAAYPTILPVFTAESALTNISFAVCKLVAVAGIKQGSYDELPITPLTKVAHDAVSQSNASNDGLDISSTSLAPSNFDSNDDMSTVKPLRITQKVNSALFTPPKEKPLMPRRPSGTSLISSIITSEKKEASRNRNKLNLSIPTDSTSAVSSRRGSVSSNMGQGSSAEREVPDTNTSQTAEKTTDWPDGNSQRLIKSKVFETVAGQSLGGPSLPSNIGKTKPASFLSLGKGYQQSSDSFVTAPEDNKDSPTTKLGNSDASTRSNLTLEPTLNVGSPRQEAELGSLTANLTMNNDSSQSKLSESAEIAKRSSQNSEKQSPPSVPVVSSAFSSPRSLPESDSSDLNVTPKGVSPKVLPQTLTNQPDGLKSGNDEISPEKSPEVELKEPISKQGDVDLPSHSEKDDIGLSSLDTGKQSRNLGKLMKMSSDLSGVSSKHYSTESTESAKSNSTPASSKKSASTRTSPISSVNRHMQTPSGVHSYSPSHVIATVTPERRVFNGFTEDSYDDSSSDDGSANTMVSDDDSTYQALKNSMRRNRAASPGSLVSVQNLAHMEQIPVSENNLKPGDTPIVDTLGGSPFNFETSSGLNGTPQTITEAMSVTPLETNFPTTAVYDKGFTSKSYHIKPTSYASDVQSTSDYSKVNNNVDELVETTGEAIAHRTLSDDASSMSSSNKEVSPLTPQKVRLPGSNTGTLSKRPIISESPSDEQRDTRPLQIGSAHKLHNAVSSPTSDSTVSTEEPYSANPEVFSPMRGESFLLNSAFSVTPLGIDATTNSKAPLTAASSSGASVRRVKLGSTKKPHATVIQHATDSGRMSDMSDDGEERIMTSGGSSNYTGTHGTPEALTGREGIMTSAGSSNYAGTHGTPAAVTIREGIMASGGSSNYAGTHGTPAAVTIREGIMASGGSSNYAGTHGTPAAVTIREGIMASGGSSNYTGTHGTPSAVAAREGTKLSGGSSNYTGAHGTPGASNAKGDMMASGDSPTYIGTHGTSGASNAKGNMIRSGDSPTYAGAHGTTAAISGSKQTPISQNFDRSGLSPAADTTSTRECIADVASQSVTTTDAKERSIGTQSRSVAMTSEIQPPIQKSGDSSQQSKIANSRTEAIGIFSATKPVFDHIQQETISAGSELDDANFQRGHSTSTGPLPTSSEYDSVPATVNEGIAMSPTAPSSSSTDFEQYPTGTMTESHMRPYNVSHLPENSRVSAAASVIKRSSSIFSSPGSVATTPIVNRATIANVSPETAKLREKLVSPASSSDLSTANEAYANPTDLNATPIVAHRSPAISAIHNITEETREKRSSFSSSVSSDNIDGETLSKDAINMTASLKDNVHGTPASFVMYSSHSTPTVYAQSGNQDPNDTKPSEGPEFKKFETEAHYSPVVGSKEDISMKEKVDHYKSSKHWSADDRRIVESSEPVSFSTSPSNKPNSPIRQELRATPAEDQNDNTHTSSDSTLEVLQHTQARDNRSSTDELSHTSLTTPKAAGDSTPPYETFNEDKQLAKQSSGENHESSTIFDEVTGIQTVQEVRKELHPCYVSTDEERASASPSTAIVHPSSNPSKEAVVATPTMNANKTTVVAIGDNDLAKSTLANPGESQHTTTVQPSASNGSQQECTPVQMPFESPKAKNHEPVSIPPGDNITPIKTSESSQVDNNKDNEVTAAREHLAPIEAGEMTPQEKLSSTTSSPIDRSESEVPVSKPPPARTSSTTVSSDGATKSVAIGERHIQEQDHKPSPSLTIGRPLGSEEPKDDHSLPKYNLPVETTHTGKDKTTVMASQNPEHPGSATIPKDSLAVKLEKAVETSEKGLNISRNESQSMNHNARPSAAPLILKINNNAPLSREAEKPRKTTTYEPETPRADLYGTPRSPNSTYTDQSDDYDDDGGELDFNVDDFDIENPDNTLAELLLYLEHQTIDVISTIQSLLTGIKQPKATTGVLRRESNAINQVIGQMAGATSVSMNQSRNAALKEHGNWVVQSLVDCRRRMTVLCNLRPDGVLVADERDDQFADKHFKQRLAGVAFDVAKCTKELVKTVEEASLKEEIEYLNSKLAK